MNGEECNYEHGDTRLSGKRWGDAGGIPAIALHGWLDNSASFDFIAPQLTSLNLVALDLAGHAKSSHRGGLSAYNIWQDFADILVVAEEMGWQRFALLGHSRGAIISNLFAGTYPEKVTHLAAIESLLPFPVEANTAPTQLAAAINHLLDVSGQPRKYYRTFDEAVLARENGFFKLNSIDAKVLARRGVFEDIKGFYWGNDARLLAPSEVKFTPDQIDAFMARVTVPRMLILGDNGIFKGHENVLESMIKSPKVSVETFAGEHHLHMSQQHEKVAETLNVYFSQKF